MPKFNIYPKEGEMFTIECQSIKRNEEGFALRGGDHEGFVFLKSVAAIILVERFVDEKNEIDNVWFDGCLKDHSKPAKVFAHTFRTDPKIIFKIKKRDGTEPHSERLIEDIYIDPSEVVAIMPKGFLESDEAAAALEPNFRKAAPTTMAELVN